MLYALATTVLLATAVTELLARKKLLPYWVARKVLHITAVGSCAVAALYVERELLTWIVAIAELALLGLISANVLMREESGRRAWGIVWFPLAFLVLLLTVQDDHHVFWSMLMLAVCDPLATIIGKLRPHIPFNLTGDGKTLSGSLAFSASAAGILAFVFAADYWWHLPFYALLLAAAEALGSKGRDNLYVPLLAAFLLEEGAVASWLPEILLLGAVVFCYVLVKRGSLTLDGALAAITLGSIVSLKSGPEWLLPLFFFLLSSSLIGKLLPVRTLAGDAKQKQARDAAQVMANGAVYGLMVVWQWPSPGFLYLIVPVGGYGLLAVMAVATADTWSSEIGQHFRQPTYDLIRWQRVPPGLSGGVSLAGTLAGLAGATLLVGSCFWLLPNPTVSEVVTLIAFGFAGMLLDSILGSLFQAKYADAEGNHYDAPAPDRKLVGGLAWITNDWVNFLAILLTSLVYVYSR